MLSRRKLLSRLTNLTLMSFLTTRISVVFAATSKTQQRATITINPTATSSITAHFMTLGYKTVAAQKLITGHLFNGGVRFDETRQIPLTGNTITVQNCIRIDDISTSTPNETLPYFHIIAFSRETPSYRGEVLLELLNYLVKPLNLDPSRLILVSTDRINAYMPHLEKVGIKKAQIIYRSDEEAQALGDGSGYFNPEGHPYIDGIHTVSFHYALDPSIMNSPLQYPITGSIELGEFVLTDHSKEQQQSETGGFGVERLQMAQTGQGISYELARQQAITNIEKESKQLNIALPKAYEVLKAN